jgi:hypothetical protein
MSSVAISGNAGGAGVFTITSPSSASSFTATLPAATTTLVGTDATQTLTNKTLTSPTVNSPTIGGTPVMGASVITSDTAQASTSGTSIDFTSIPSWVKRITVMFSGVSTNSTSPIQVQIGDSGGVEASGYIGTVGVGQNSNYWIVASLSAGFAISTSAGDSAAGNIYSGSMILSNITGNNWVCQSSIGQSAGGAIRMHVTGGNKNLSATLDRVRITTVNGTDTFDAGSINILYE